MKSRAFCPGHVTGFFEVVITDDALSTGSRGAGICTSLGATTEVQVERTGAASLSININGLDRDAPITRRAVELIAGDEPLSVSVATSLDLPEGQGFGMSAAGALSTGIALCDALGIDRQKAFEAAHLAEVELGGGLGDVSALRMGGVTVRDRAGLPPKGNVTRIEGVPDMVLAVLGQPLSTASVLRDADAVSRINAHGARRVDELLRNPSVEHMMLLSQSFAVDTKLASREVLAAIDAVKPPGIASMSMLGNSVFAIGVGENAPRSLAPPGDLYSCVADLEGPRLV